MDFKCVLARKPVADIIASQDSSERRQLVIGGFVAVVAAVAPLDVLSQRRHAVRLHPGLRHGHLAEVGRPHGASPLSRAPCALGAAAGHSRLPRPDGRPGAAAWLRLVSWLAIGLVVYFTYGRFHSLLKGRR